jgi:hypothetical protein
MNPQTVSQQEYNQYTRERPLNKGYLFVIDFVHDVEHIEENQITREEYRELLNKAGVR